MSGHRCPADVRSICPPPRSWLTSPASFIVAVNGRKIFLKGMNWTPVDAIYARINDARYRELLLVTKDACINALRVWGGGIYEHDSFYAQCDELGILVTHDFMFACGCYPQDPAFLAEARREAEFQAAAAALRLRGRLVRRQ